MRKICNCGGRLKRSPKGYLGTMDRQKFKKFHCPNCLREILIMGLILIMFISLTPSVLGECGEDTDCLVSSIQACSEDPILATSTTSLSHSPNKIYFYQIDYYHDMREIIYEFNAAQVTGEKTYGVSNCLWKISGVQIGESTMIQTIVGSKVRIYHFFGDGDWNIGTYTGTKTVDLTYNATAIPMTIDNRCSSYPPYYGNTTYPVTPAGIGSNSGLDVIIKYYKTFYHYYRYGDYQGFYRVNVTRTVNEETYTSHVIIWTDSQVYYDYETTDDISILTFEAPVYLSILDCYDVYHNYTLFEGEEGEIYDNRLYGVIRDSEGGYGLQGVDVTFAGVSTNTTNQGFYQIFKDAQGTFTFSLEKEGYIPRSQMLDYDPPQIHNDVMSINRSGSSTIPGTATVYGIVLDNITAFPLSSALVRIYNGTYQTYTYSNQYGSFIFDGLGTGVYTLTGELDDYYKGAVQVNITAINQSYYYQLELLPEGYVPSVPGATPTPAPRPGFFDLLGNLFNLFGVESNDAHLIMGTLVVIFCAGIFTGLTKAKSPMMTGLGAFVGFLFAIGTNLYPRWMLALIIMVCAGVFAYFLIGRR